MIKFSIITVCLNAGNDLLETVESTLKQSYSEFEIIVKDGFSKDESICKLPQDKRIHLVQKRDTGILATMKRSTTAWSRTMNVLLTISGPCSVTSGKSWTLWTRSCRIPG